MNFDRFEKITQCLICGTSDLRIVDINASIWQCNQCKFKFVSPRPTQDSIMRSYNTGQIYDQWIADEANRKVLWECRFDRVRNLVLQGNILDIGAGIGTFLDIARKNGFAIHGTETSSTAAAKAKELYNIDLMVGQIEDQKLNENSFNLITMWHVLEHVPYPMKTLKECFRLLKPGGFLVIAVPNDFELKNRFKNIMGLSPYNLLTPLEEIHLSHFNPQTISYAMRKSGFSIHELGLDKYLPLYTLKTRLKYILANVVRIITSCNFYNTIFAVGKKDML